MKSSSTIVPVVFSTNDKYAPYLAVTIQSLIDHASENNEYHLYVLYTQLSDKNIQRLTAIVKQNVKLDFINVESVTDKVPLKTGSAVSMKHITSETYYRIFIPSLLTQYSKIIYLDCDLILLCDVAELLQVNLQKKPIGAVYSAPYWTSSTGGLSDSSEEDELFNAGVLVFDTAVYKEQRVLEKAVELLKAGEIFPSDQELLRKVLRNKTTYIDNHWNFPWHFMLIECPQLRGQALEAYLQVKNDPYIVHYTSPIKPWNRPYYEMADYFWRYAKQTDFYEQIMYNNIDEGQQARLCFIDFIFPFRSIQKNGNIVLYGAGVVGQAFYSQIKTTGYCNCALWVDSQYEIMQKKGLPVFAADELFRTDFDALVIAVESEKTADNIRNSLVRIGVDENKIIWESPLK